MTSMSQDNLAAREEKTHDLDLEQSSSVVPGGIATTESRAEVASLRRSDWKRQPDHAVVAESSAIKNLVMTAGVGVICGFVGAAGYLYFVGPKPSESSSTAEQSGSGSEKAVAKKKKSDFSGTRTVMESNSHGAAWIPGFTSSDDAETLKKQIANLVQRLDGLTERLDRMTRPKDETPPVLHTMQVKMVALAKAVDDVSSLPGKFRQSDRRFEILQAEIKTLRSRIEALAVANGRAEREASSPAPAASIPAAAAPPAANGQDPNPTMELGIKLLQRGQNGSAREVFARLQNAHPNDARVWYFAALAAGLTTGNWEGEAKQFVDKGVERERSGSPSTAEVDAALKTRVPIEGMPWLNSLRKQGLSANHAP
jgi:hypothetical protein